MVQIKVEAEHLESKHLPKFGGNMKKITVVVVVAQLVERWLLIPEVGGSNPVIGKNY